jgi:hypothetical protein
MYRAAEIFLLYLLRKICVSVFVAEINLPEKSTIFIFHLLEIDCLGVFRGGIRVVYRGKSFGVCLIDFSFTLLAIWCKQ